jgi:hypothetical protein
LLTGLGLESVLPSPLEYEWIYQFVTVSILAPFGVSHDDALAYSFVMQALGYVVVVAVGLPAIYGVKDWRRAMQEAAPVAAK